MQVLLKLGWFFRLHWRRYALAFVMLVMIAALIMVPPWITGRVVDAIAERRLTLDSLLLHAGIIAAVAAAVYILRIIWRRALYGASFQLAALLRRRIYEHLTLMSPAFFQRQRTGDVMARATNDATAVEMTAGEGVLALVDGAMTGVIVLAMMIATLSWKLTLLALLPWPVMTYFMWRFGNELHAAFGESQKQFSRLNEQTQESLTGVRLIQAFGLQQKYQTEFAAVAAETSRANLRVARVDAKYDPVIFVTIGSSFLLAVAGGAWWIRHGELTVGELTTFTMYLGYLIWPMFAFGWTLNILERGAAAHARIEELLAAKPDISDTGTHTEIQTPRLDIDITRFSYHHADSPPRTGEQEHAVLRGIRLHIAAGATLGIVGPTGAGKSTLLNLLLRLYENGGTDIRLDGLPLQEYRLDALREQFGFVPQDPFLFSVTLAENISLGRPDASMEEIRAAARLACIDEDILAFPDRYQTLVGERGITLSGGQKQRIAIARALLRDPPILLLDDALSAVDVRTESIILDHLKTQRRGRTNLIAAHRLSSVMDADHIIVLRHGEITERGTHRELMTLNGWYAQMFRYQQIEAAMEAHD